VALEGELRDFNILEVIQLLGQQGKTGVLKIWGWGKRGDEAGIYFAEGRITHAASNQRTKGDLLGERLAKTGIISRDDLYAALRNQKKSGRFLGEIVVEQGMAEEQAVLNVLYTQTHELIYEVFRLEIGKFEFEPRSVAELPKVSLRLNADEVMLNILKMVDEWPEIEKRIPPPTMVLQKTEMLEKHGITLSEDHDAVYLLVNGTRSVQEIVELSRLGKFATLEILATLLEEGDISEKGIKRDEATVTKRPAPQELRPGLAYTWYAIGLGLALILFVVSFYPFTFDFIWGSPRGETPATQGYIEEVRQERVEWGTRIFFLEQGRYPEDLSELVDAGILTEKDVQGPDV
jgi:hypothetical protein